MEKDKSKKLEKISRREFLKKAGIIIGGAALGSLALSSCDVAVATNTPATSTTTNGPGTTTSNPPTTQEGTTSTQPPTSTATPPASTTENPPTSSTTSPPTTTDDNGWRLQVPGCSSYVATDRLYSADHVWVMKLGNGSVRIGMSDPFQVLADRVNTCWLSPVGTVLHKDDAFGYIEADKLNVDLITPVSGTVTATNDSLMAIPAPINADPYVTGWMLEIELSDPSELDDLFSPQYYAYLESPDWPGPVPPMH